GLEPARALEIAAALADALDYAHKRRVVHRDLKPANVIVDGAGSPHILDFGVAKDLTRKGTTLAGEVLGTPNYMPPEQADGRLEEIGPRSDIYSLGAVLYELLTGSPPFVGATPFEVVREVLTRPPVPLREANPAISRDVEAIVLRCLEKKPSERYADAAALRDDLELVAAGGSLGGDGSRRATTLAVAAVAIGLACGALLAWRILVPRSSPDPEAVATGEKAGEKEKEQPPGRVAAEILAQARQRLRAGGDPASIEADLLRCLAVDPSCHEARLELGSLALATGDLREARRQLEALSPADPRAQEAAAALRGKIDGEAAAQERALAEAALAARELRMHDALETLERAAKRRSRSPRIRLELARLLAAHGRAREALAESREASLLDSSLGEWLAPEQEQYLKKDLERDERPAGSRPLSRAWEPILGGAFGEQGDLLTGSAEGLGPYALAVLIRGDAPAAESYTAKVELSLDSGDPAPYAGLVFAARSPDDFFLAYVYDHPSEVKRRFGEAKVEKLHEVTSQWPKGLRIARVTNGKWLPRGEELVQVSEAGWARLTVTVSGDQATVTAGYGSFPVKLDRKLDGRAGVLKFYDTKVRFRSWEWSRN
ncbi:protein kinase, partial [bacterium]|nr:protein kinase [bacterium]